MKKNILNNKGFTIYELLIGFVFLVIISFFLMSTVFSLKDKNQSNVLKTKLIDLKIAMMKDIEADISQYKLVDAISCGSSCINFYFNNSITKQLNISTSNSIVTYGTNEYMLVSGSYIGTIDITLNSIGGESIVKVKVPILHDDISGDYGINIVTKYYPNALSSMPIYNFVYTGNYQIFSAPVAGKYKIELWGAQGGGNNPQSIVIGSRGGAGAYTSGQITLTKDENIYIYIGGAGECAGTLSAGGYNGGGFATWGNPNAPVGGGGGATDVRLVSGLWNDITSLNSRIMVAGGGGGADDTGADSGTYLGSNDESGGGGGTLNGIAPRTAGTYASYGFGTQTSGGVASTGGISGGLGYGGATNDPGDYGGGGGGFYGGASGGGSYQGGGGGSSFISGYAGCITHSSGKTFTNGSMLSGTQSMPSISGGTEIGHTGNGYAKITWVGY